MNSKLSVDFNKADDEVTKVNLEPPPIYLGLEEINMSDIQNSVLEKWTLSCDSDQTNVSVETDSSTIASDTLDAVVDNLPEKDSVSKLSFKAKTIRHISDHESMLDNLKDTLICVESRSNSELQGVLTDVPIGFEHIAERALKIATDTNISDFDQMKTSLETYLAEFEKVQKEDIDKELQKSFKMFEKLPVNSNSDFITVELERAAKSKDELFEASHQYKQSRILLETLSAQHECNLKKQSAYAEKTNSLANSHVVLVETYKTLRNSYEDLLCHLTNLVAEGDATCTAMIERHEKATLDSRTKARLLQLKKSNLEKQENELASQVDELMDILENILAARAEAVQTQSVDEDSTF